MNKKRKREPLKVIVVNPPTKEEADKKIEEISKSLSAIYGKKWNEK